MRQIQALFFVVVIALTCGVSIASAQSLRKVSPSKYETRTPLKGYSFDWEHPVNEGDASLFPDGLYFINYKKDEGYGYLKGVLDRRGKRAEWVLQPHYESISVFGPNLLTVKKRSGENETRCLLNIDQGECVPTDAVYQVELAYSDSQKLPDWVNENALATEGRRYGVFDLQIYGPDGKRLAEVKNVMHEKKERMSAYALGDSLVLRTSPAGDVMQDIVLNRLEDGSVTQTLVPTFSILSYSENRRPVKDGKFDYSNPMQRYEDFQLMFTADAEMGLVWPFYETENGFRLGPSDLLGLKPLGFTFFEYPKKPGKGYAATNSAPFYCCKMPLGWVVTWDTPNGIRHALLPQKTIPTFEEVLSSRDDAIYRRFDPLWQPGETDDEQTIAQDQGQMIGQYAFHRTDGIVEIYRDEFYGIDDGKTMELIHTVSETGFADWRSRTMRERARQRSVAVQELAAINRAIDEHNRRMDAAWAAAEKRADDINAQRASAAAERRAVQAQERAVLEADRASKAAAERAAMDAEAARQDAWNSWRSNTEAKSGTSQTAPVDYWKSYDSSNTTGQYTTSSGAGTGCRLGSSDC